VLLHKEAVRARNPSALAQADLCLTIIISSIGNMSLTHRFMDETNALARFHGSDECIAAAAYASLYVNGLMCEFDKAKQAADDSIRLCTGLGDSKRVRETLQMSAVIYVLQDKFVEAIENGQSCLIAHKDAGDVGMELNAMFLICNCHCWMGDYELAASYFPDPILEVGIERPYSWSRIFTNFKMGKWKEAEEELWLCYDAPIPGFFWSSKGAFTEIIVALEIWSKITISGKPIHVRREDDYVRLAENRGNALKQHGHDIGLK
jgi:hypothetical protein